MSRLTLAIVVSLAAACATACATRADEEVDTSDQDLTERFVSTEDALPADWSSYTRHPFALSQRYPTFPPAAVYRPWKAIDFRQDPDAYILALRDYCLRGMVGGDPDDDLRPERTGARWYNVPWMHVGARGRESMRGLTREREAPAGRLAPTQKKTVQDWGIGFYNDVGGYTVGQVWRNANAPDPSAAHFLEGAVVFKVLFTAATVEEVPWTAGAPTWYAHIPKTLTGTVRTIAPVRLLQMDIAVKDSRSPVGWVYATLEYDAAAHVTSGSASLGAWGRLVPVGLAFGNDPQAGESGALRETILADAIPSRARATLGWGGRLDGPIDKADSACVSCHMTAQYPSKSPFSPPSTYGTVARAKWLRNLPSGTPFDVGATSLDTSLQLQISLEAFYDVGNR